MTDHPTPWRVEDIGDGEVVLDADDYVVGLYANNRRIVAAVNAMENLRELYNGERLSNLQAYMGLERAVVDYEKAVGTNE